MVHKHVLKSFDFTDLRQRRDFFRFIMATFHLGTTSFLVKIRLLKGDGRLVGININEIIKKIWRFGSIRKVPALPIFDLEDDEEIMEISLKIITTVIILKELRDA